MLYQASFALYLPCFIYLVFPLTSCIYFTVIPLAITALASIFLVVILLACHKYKIIRLKRIRWNNFTAELESTNLESTRMTSLQRSLSDSVLSDRSADISKLSAVCEASTSTAPPRYLTRYQAKMR